MDTEERDENRKRQGMRKLSPTFMGELKDGILSGLLDEVRQDKDLDFEIRNDYLSLYYKGNSLLKLTETKRNGFSVGVHKKFLGDLQVSHIRDRATAESFIKNIPYIKQRIIQYGKKSLEVEYEQLIIRANNDELRNNSEYFVIDRQYAIGQSARFDLTGLFWAKNNRHRGKAVPLAFMEVKFALNQDIRDLDEQLERYYKEVARNTASIAQEAETIFKQKLELGLFDQDSKRLAALKTLRISQDLSQYQFIVVLVDYNQNSRLFHLDKLRRLPFSDQILIFRGGFAIWQQNLEKLAA